MNNYYDDDKQVNIPEFLADRDTSDTSADMSIFKMSDEELYDDYDEQVDEPKAPRKKNKGKIGSTVILCLIVIAILIATSVISVIYGISQHKAYVADHDKISQYETQISDLTAANAKLETENATLTAQISSATTTQTTADPNAKYASGTKMYITKEGGGQGVRTSADVDSDIVTKNGSDYCLYWGESVTLTDNATVDASGNYWGKIDGGYIRIEYDGEAWASTEVQ